MNLNLNEFLLWLASVTGSGAVASFILERLAFFQSLSVEGKKWVSFGTMAGLGVSAFLILTYVSAETLSLVAPYFAIVASAFVSVFSGEFFHRFMK